VLDAVAHAHGAKPAEVALAWLIAREGVTAPIASATSVDQLDSLARATQLKLSAEEIEILTAASD
jgi:aryl-alcohol dehydrogenase-like predicted oxidoreductase